MLAPDRFSEGGVPDRAGGRRESAEDWGGMAAMSPLCPLDDEHLPLVTALLKDKQVIPESVYAGLATDSAGSDLV